MRSSWSTATPRPRSWDELGVADVLAAGFDRDDLLDALRAVTRPIVRRDELPPSAPPARDGPEWRGRLVAVTGSGGVGRSTVAMALDVLPAPVPAAPADLDHIKQGSYVCGQTVKSPADVDLSGASEDNAQAGMPSPRPGSARSSAMTITLPLIDA